MPVEFEIGIVKQNKSRGEFLKIKFWTGIGIFFKKTLDSENRIIYNMSINEFAVEKFISFGSGVI